MYVPINIWLQTVTYIATTIYLKKYFLYVTKIKFNNDPCIHILIHAGKWLLYVYYDN